MGKKSEEKRKATEHAIKKAALRLFSEKGFHMTSTNDITRAAGVSKGTLYWYYKSKEFIAYSLASDMLEDFLKLIEKARDGDGPVLQRFEQLVREVGSLYYKEIEYLRLLWKVRFERRYIFKEEYTEKVTSYYVSIRKAIESLIRQGIKSGEFRKVNTKRMSFILLGVAEGLEVEWLENIDELSMDDALQEIMSIIIQYLKK